MKLILTNTSRLPDMWTDDLRKLLEKFTIATDGKLMNPNICPDENSRKAALSAALTESVALGVELCLTIIEHHAVNGGPYGKSPLYDRIKGLLSDVKGL